MSDEHDQAVGVRELGHVVLYVADVRRSGRFYGEVLNWPAVPVPEGAPFAVYSTGRTHHDLLLIEVGGQAAPIPHGRRLGLYHFAVKVGDTDAELLAMLERVRGAPDVATVVGASDHGLTHSVYLHDPDGNEVEIYIDVAGMDWRNDHTLLGLPTRPLVIDGATVA